MRLLLDTHTFLWFVNEDTQLSSTAKNLLESDVDLWLSVASLWEISIKVSIGKLTLLKSFDIFVAEQLQINEIEILPIQIEHLHHLSSLSLHHRDPFDRLLITQALVEGISIVSADKVFDLYDVSRVW